MALVALGQSAPSLLSRPPVSVPLSEPILAGATHHYSSTDWTTLAGNVTNVADQVGAINMAHFGTVGETVLSTSGKGAWDVFTTPSSFMRSSAAGGDVYASGAMIIVFEIPVGLPGQSNLCSWGPTQGIVLNSLGNVQLWLNSVTAKLASANGIVVADTPIVIGVSWDTVPGAGSNRYRIATQAGVIASTDAGVAATPSGTDFYDSGAVNSVGFGVGNHSVYSFRGVVADSAGFMDSAELAAQTALFGAYWL